MSKEQLEEIERYHSNKKDVMWAVRQIKLLQAENETLSSANQDLLHEVRVLRNKVDQSKEYEDFVFHHNVDVDLEMRKIHEKNKRYRERIEEIEAKNWEFIVQNKRYREAFEEMFESMGVVDRQKYGKRLKELLESESDE